MGTEVLREEDRVAKASSATKGSGSAPKGNRPLYNVRAKVREDNDGNAIFATVGAAWPFNQGDGLNVRINMLPVNFDGTLMLVPPKDE